MKTILFTLAMMLVMYENECWSQNESKTPETCIYIPKNLSVRCDDYNKDFTLDVSVIPPCTIHKMEVFTRWGTPVFTTTTAPWSWYGGRESAGVYNIVLTYSKGLNQATEGKTMETLQQSVNLIK
jgi:hypothetical protein